MNLKRSCRSLNALKNAACIALIILSGGCIHEQSGESTNLFGTITLDVVSQFVQFVLAFGRQVLAAFLF